MQGPSFTPAQGYGTQYGMNGTVWSYSPSGWSPIANTSQSGLIKAGTGFNTATSSSGQSSAVPAAGAQSNPQTDLAAYLKTISDNFANSIKSIQAPTPQPAKTINLDPSLFKIPDLDPLIKEAYDKLAPYYAKLLAESQGDVNKAMARLEEDYASGMRYNTEDVERETGYAKTDLDAALSQLGITFPQEQEKLLDTQNQRGIALTESPQPNGGIPQPLQVASEGRAGYETGTLREDQKLRQEAVQRTAQRNVDQITTQGQRTASQLGSEKTRGGEDVQRQGQLKVEELEDQRQSKAMQAGQMKQNQQIADAQMKIMQAQLAKM